MAPPVTSLVIGLPLYGPGEHLQEALQTLLAQTRTDLAIVVTDDSGHPQARAVLDRCGDPRVRYHRNERRLGLVGNWRRAFEVARREHPEAPYFAWASDHDAWHPTWAERLLAVLDAEPDAVLAFPQVYRTGREGGTLRTPPSRFDTGGEPSPARRVRATVRGMSAGNMVYGVYRAPALERAGVFRYTLSPDRLLLSELSIQGQLRRVDERLFYRRMTDPPSHARQRAAFWPDGAPWWSHAPWGLQHVVLLARGGADRATLAAFARATLAQNVRSFAGVLYYEKIMRRRSLKVMAANLVHRAARR
jgi:glycosyltransferase involved in cell wall biosynthesis